MFDSIANLLGKAADKIWPDPKDKALAQAAIIKAEQAGALKELQIEADQEIARIKAQQAILVSDSKGKSGLQRMWRPILLLEMGLLLGLFWMDWAGDHIQPDQIDWLFRIIGASIIGIAGAEVYERKRENRHIERLHGKHPN